MHWAPSANEIDEFLLNIARKHGVEWKPKMRQEEKYVHFRMQLHITLMSLQDRCAF